MGGSVGGAADQSCDERDRIVRGMIVRGIFLGLRLRRAVILAFFAVLKFYVCRKERRERRDPSKLLERTYIAVDGNKHVLVKLRNLVLLGVLLGCRPNAVLVPVASVQYNGFAESKEII